MFNPGTQLITPESKETSVPNYIVPPVVDSKFVEIKTYNTQIKIVGVLTPEVEKLIHTILARPSVPIFKLPKTLKYVLYGIASMLIFSLIYRYVFRFMGN